jgi:anaerobic nitric oxide reductase transcription regulator
VDVRIVAATHQALAQQTQSGEFPLRFVLPAGRLFHSHSRRWPSTLRTCRCWWSIFCSAWAAMSRSSAIDAGALAKLGRHDWPGNVRELEHVLERAAILAGAASC